MFRFGEYLFGIYRLLGLGELYGWVGGMKEFSERSLGLSYLIF